MSFQVKRLIAGEPVSGTVLVTDCVGNVSEIPISSVVPVIDFYIDNSDICSPTDEDCSASECDLVTITGEESFADTDIVKWEWDLTSTDTFNQPDAVGVSIEFSWRHYDDRTGETDNCDVNDSGEYKVWLRATDEIGSQAIASKTITIHDTCPESLNLYGPTTGLVDEKLFYNVVVDSSCDDISEIQWTSGSGNPPTNPFDGWVYDDNWVGWEKDISFGSAGVYWIAARAIDEDGDFTDPRIIEIVITDRGPIFPDRSLELKLETKYHVYDPFPDTSGYITHTAQMSFDQYMPERYLRTFIHRICRFGTERCRCRLIESGL